MRTSHHLLAFCVLLCSFAGTALAAEIPEQPVLPRWYDCAPWIGDGYYGISGNRDTTIIRFGTSYRQIMIPFHVSAALALLLPVAAAGLLWQSTRRRENTA